MLVQCRECEHRVSTEADNCPKCGCPQPWERPEDLAKEKNMAFVGKIPFDKNFTESMIQGKNIIETDDNSQASIAVRKIWENVMALPAMKIERLT